MPKRTFKEFANHSFWRDLSNRSYFVFMISVFFLFATIGFITDIWTRFQLPMPRLIASVIYSGLIAVGYAYSFTRNIRWLPLVIVVQVGFVFINWTALLGPATDTIDVGTRSLIDGIGILFCVILAYVVFINFISLEGIKQIRMKTEMDLAADIHRRLVPDIRHKDERLEVLGYSQPASYVGGDLIDMVKVGDDWHFYLADVTGHGVGPGLLGGMLKAAMRMALADGHSLAEATNRIQDLLWQERRKSMFVTLAGVTLTARNEANIIVAGHLPVIHVLAASGENKQLLQGQPGIFLSRDHNFRAETVKLDPGDILCLVSDGITETMDTVGSEFGMERLMELINTNINNNLKIIESQLEEALNSHGKGHDDQSVILIRIFQ